MPLPHGIGVVANNGNRRQDVHVVVENAGNAS